MPLLLLLLLAVVCLRDDWPAPPEWLGMSPNPLRFTLLTWTGVAVMAALAYCLAQRVARGIARYPEQRETILHRYASRRLYYLITLFAFYGTALYLLGWGWTVKAGLGASAGAELLRLAPFVVCLVLGWTLFYDAERALHDHGPPTVALRPFWSRRAYVTFQIRHNLALIFAPLLLMIAAKGMQQWFPGEEYGDLVAVFAFGMLVTVFISLPWILRLVLGLKPMPAGPLRDRLLAAARRLNFRCSNILLWNTHGGVANAMVAGIFPYPRYVLLTDRLVQELTPEEVEAVFGHEVGHVKHRHMLFYFGFLMASMFVVGWVWKIVWDVAVTYVASLKGFEANDDWTLVGIVGAYIFVVFGFLSRRCERQADVFGCRAVSCPRPDCVGHGADAVLLPNGLGLCPTGIRIFIEALEKVARLNGISRSRPGWLQSWQHSTIARRVEFLQRVLANPREESRFQRTVFLVKWTLVLALAGVMLLLWWTQPGS